MLIGPRIASIASPPATGTHRHGFEIASAVRRSQTASHDVFVLAFSLSLDNSCSSKEGKSPAERYFRHGTATQLRDASTETETRFSGGERRDESNKATAHVAGLWIVTQREMKTPRHPGRPAGLRACLACRAPAVQRSCRARYEMRVMQRVTKDGDVPCL